MSTRAADVLRALSCGAAALLWGAAAFAQAAPERSAAAHQPGDTLPDPRRAVVVLEEMGDVGFRIADAQAVAEAVQRGLRKRVGRDGVVYAGIVKSQRELQKMLGPSVETPEIQQKKLDYFKAAEDNATWLVRARFGTAKKGPKEKRHWISVACRKKGTDPKQPADERRVEAASFLEAREALEKALPTFCGQLPSIEAIPMEGLGAPTPAEPPGMRKKEPPKPWSPPPPRP